MDIPLTFCTWLSEFGVEMLSRLLPDREPMIVFYDRDHVPFFSEVVEQVETDYHGNLVCYVPFGIRFKSSMGWVLYADLIEGYLYKVHWISHNEHVLIG